MANNYKQYLLHPLGAFAPLTTEGMIMVDGVLASCYASFHHDLAHLTMIPMQRFSEVLEWTFGDDTGDSAFVSTVKELGMFLLPAEYLWH